MLWLDALLFYHAERLAQSFPSEALVEGEVRARVVAHRSPSGGVLWVDIGSGEADPRIADVDPA